MIPERSFRHMTNIVSDGVRSRYWTVILRPLRTAVDIHRRIGQSSDALALGEITDGGMEKLTGRLELGIPGQTGPMGHDKPGSKVRAPEADGLAWNRVEPGGTS